MAQPMTLWRSGAARAVLALLVASGCTQQAGSPRQTLDVYAASSLVAVLPTLATTFEATRGSRLAVRCNFASSSTLAKQITHGAPADVFVSAHTEWIRFLLAKDRLEAATLKLFATNQVVVVTPKAMDVAPLDTACKQLAETVGKIAMGDPTHVPAGVYAKQALVHLGIWPRVADRVVPAHSVREALRLVEQGACKWGLVYRTDAQASDRVRITGTLSEESHQPIRYDAAAVSGGPSVAKDFVAFLASEQAQSILAAHGFGPPPSPGNQRPLASRQSGANAKENAHEPR